MKAFSLSYFIRKVKNPESSYYKLFGRLSTNGKRIDFSLNRKIKPANWDATKNQLKGRDKEVKELEKYLATIEETFYRLERELLQKSIPITGKNLLKAFNDTLTGIVESKKTLMDIFELHNKQISELYHQGQIVRPTVTRYTTTKNYIQEFLFEKTKCRDIVLEDLAYSFVLEFDHWIRTQKRCAHNTTLKYIKNFRKVVKMAIDYEWLNKDPFISYKAKSKPVLRECLNMEELKRIENLITETPRLNKVRQWFLFSCYTGLSYIDISALKPENIQTDNFGAKWIIKERKKTKIVSRIPLLPKAEIIINHFSNDPQSIRKGLLFPAISNQKLNEYLKEIAVRTEIKKKLTFHIARHTFATTVTLANGVSLEAVSAQLGHSNIKQTQHYARMVDSRIKKEMDAIKNLFT